MIYNKSNTKNCEKIYHEAKIIFTRNIFHDNNSHKEIFIYLLCISNLYEKIIPLKTYLKQDRLIMETLYVLGVELIKISIPLTKIDRYYTMHM